MVPQTLIPEISVDSALKCTIVSLVPFTIKEFKPGLYPPSYELAASKDWEPEVLHVGPAFHYAYIDETRGSLSIKTSSDDVARSVIYDYSSSQLEVGPDAGPGLFWVPGALDRIDIKHKHQRLLDEARRVQINWFNNLVTLADKDWAQYERPNVITKTQRIAGEVLKLNPDKHRWMREMTIETALTCPACTSLYNVGTVVCPNCRCILDKEKYKTLQFAEV